MTASSRTLSRTRLRLRLRLLFMVISIMAVLTAVVLVVAWHGSSTQRLRAALKAVEVDADGRPTIHGKDSYRLVVDSSRDGWREWLVPTYRDALQQLHREARARLDAVRGTSPVTTWRLDDDEGASVATVVQFGQGTLRVQAGNELGTRHLFLEVTPQSFDHIKPSFAPHVMTEGDW